MGINNALMRLCTHADALGSIVKTTDSAGDAISDAQYDAFGNPQSVGGSAFTGREWDEEIGLYYYRARYYDPKVGRFISEDPISFRGGINFFTYVQNNPVKYRDSFGLYDPNPLPGPGAAIEKLITGWSNLNRTAQTSGYHEGMDKYFHCIATCQAASSGAGAETTTRVFAEARETIQELGALAFSRGIAQRDAFSDSAADRDANQAGMSCAAKRIPCSDGCEFLRPPGIPRQ